jgi:hypothetical protein
MPASAIQFSGCIRPPSANGLDLLFKVHRKT